MQVPEKKFGIWKFATKHGPSVICSCARVRGEILLVAPGQIRIIYSRMAANFTSQAAEEKLNNAGVAGAGKKESLRRPWTGKR